MKVRLVKWLVGIILCQVSLAALCSTRSVLLFSGFKVHRKYAISFFPLHIEHSVVLTKCKKGEEVYSASILSNTTSDEFSSVFCTDSQTPLSSAASPGSIKWHLHKIRNFLPKPNKTGILQRLQKSGAFSFIRMLLADRRFGRIFHWYEDMELDSNTSRCFRMARRKRYAHSNLVLFLPTTFVGVLFSSEAKDGRGNDGFYSASEGGGKEACMGGNGQKGGVSESKHATKALESGYITRVSASPGSVILHHLQPSPHPQINEAHSSVFENKPQNTHSEEEKTVWAQDINSTYASDFMHEALPLCPLVADDYATHWLSLSLSSAKLIYHVPYLKSPSYWDPRFPKTTPDEYPDSWMSDVDMSERYTYNSSEQAVLSAALAVTLETMQTKLVNFGPQFSKLMMYKLAMLAKLDTNLVLALFLSSVDKAKSMSVVEALQDIWETV